MYCFVFAYMYVNEKINAHTLYMSLQILPPKMKVLIPGDNDTCNLIGSFIKFVWYYKQQPYEVHISTAYSPQRRGRGRQNECIRDRVQHMGELSPLLRLEKCHSFAVIYSKTKCIPHGRHHQSNISSSVLCVYSGLKHFETI